MKRHHLRMAAGVCTGSEDDVLRGIANRTQTAYEENEKQQPSGARDVSSLPRSLARRMHTLVLQGSLDRGSVHQLEAELERLCEEGVTGITLDLRGLTYIEAIGVSVVAFRCGLYRRHGYDFALVRGPRAVQRAFEQAGLSELLPFRDAPAAEPEEAAAGEGVQPALALAEPPADRDPEPEPIGGLLAIQGVAEPEPTSVA